MPKVSTNVSIDAEIKARAQELLADLGMDLSTAVNIFLRQMVYEKAIPFEIRRDTRQSAPPSAGESNGKRGG
ncbi:MAG: type II toxin-antitoxin system RelB/DinJ family antitoxin [Ruminococcaceae bacterium]|nr:type II toxin-antitoxin system RelB/DinJ family antitoxin [Oscillospiraceae bacterium]